MQKVLIFLAALPSVAAQNQASLQLSVEQIGTRSPWIFWITLLVLLAALVVAGFALYRFAKRRELKVSSKPISIAEQKPHGEHKLQEKVQQSEIQAEKYLKEDERIVLRALKFKGGSAEQGTLRVVTNFSKAKLSRVLAELEQRGIVHKEQRGRKNVVSLRIQI